MLLTVDVELWSCGFVRPWFFLVVLENGKSGQSSLEESPYDVLVTQKVLAETFSIGSQAISRVVCASFFILAPELTF